jgi:hypothetical protein
MIRKIATYIAKNKFIKEALENPVDLSELWDRPSPRQIAGLVLMGFSYIIGWPAVAGLSMLAVWVREPLIAVIGCPAIYGFSHLVFFISVWLIGAPHFVTVLAKYAVGKLFIKLLR